MPARAAQGSQAAVDSEKSGLGWQEGRREAAAARGGESRAESGGWQGGGQWVGSGLTLNSKGHFLERCEMSNKCIRELTREL